MLEQGSDSDAPRPGRHPGASGLADVADADADDDKAEDDRMETVVSFDWKTYKASMLMSDGSNVDATTYAAGKDGTVIAKFASGTIHETDVPNSRLNEDGSFSVQPKISPVGTVLRKPAAAKKAAKKRPSC